ncbi:phospho-N-acetylmuramoyl-pentapeptide-transferase [Clostridium omnivorum]|uniref:Phospho-N-acetylmuramoyl-pentapeptide-transferase n=2 Tax=Clostridium omnivorum TaxID=1604902 RepID=A0ABQ5N8M7_9CLOT|nr:phospho-N-acetylmuramoyl-pentapeptide-transferase [Clostridium sp. E14]
MNGMIILTVLVSFLISLIVGTLLIPSLGLLKLGQHIREEEPEHHQKKSGTPTFGGIIFILSIIITLLLMTKNIRNEGIIALLGLLGFGFIGFLDDAMKAVRKKNLGLRAYQKMLLLVIFSAGLAYYTCYILGYGTSILIPFSSKSIQLDVWYLPFIIFYFACTTNGANLTDGLDGLAATINLLIMTFFATLSFGLGHYSLCIFCTSVVGAVAGFLKFNMYPARVFMGDTGSLALGGAVATVAMILKLPLIILLVGIIYVVEILSVVLQVSSFKLRGKRLFKMSPIHFHYELSGWDETKIVSVFSIITVIFCFIAFLALRIPV